MREFARSLSSDFDVRVLTLPDWTACKTQLDDFVLARSASIPFALQASDDLNDLFKQGPLVKLASCLALVCFVFAAFRMALRADVICSHWLAPAGLVGALVSRILHKPHVVVEHSGSLHLLGRMRGGRLLLRFVVAASQRVITVSDDLRSKLTAMHPAAAGRVEVLPMGVYDARSAAATLESKSQRQDGHRIKNTVLFVGRLTEIKGLDVLLKALSGLDGLELVVAGDGPRRRELESLALQLRIDAKFLGRVSAAERDALFVCSDVVVVPSRVLPEGRTEGMPLVCLEAMSAGRPVIAARAGGLAELIEDRENGLLFDPGDHLMLADKLKLVLSDTALWNRISENARQTAAAFLWSKTGPRFCAIVNSVLESNEPDIYDRECNARQAGA